jgi:hypothetical protein
MKTSLKLLSISILCFMMILSSCKKTDDVAPSIIGKWKWTGVNNKGLSATDFASFQGFQKAYSSFVYEFKSDNTYTITGSGLTSVIESYSLSGTTLTVKGDPLAATITATTMTWLSTKDNIEYVFTRQ